MTGLRNSPRLLKGGIVLIDPTTSAVVRIIALQYNPDTLTRRLEARIGIENWKYDEVMLLTLIKGIKQ